MARAIRIPPHQPDRPVLRLGARERTLLELVGRHPFLRTRDLARALGWTLAWTRRRRNRLITLGFLRLIGEAEIGEEMAAWGLVELTRAGLALVAAQQGLRPHAAARYTGLIGAGTDGPASARKALLRHIEHTGGAHDCFIRLIEAARDAATNCRDDALVEWRPAAACSRRRIRPDGYGVFRRDGSHYGFFLEFDRGTEKAGEYRAKFAAYHDYRDSRAFERDYDGFPTILVITTGPGPEQRIARAVRAVGLGREPPLSVLLTTKDRIREASDGLLGPVWREATSLVRRPWFRPNDLGVRRTIPTAR